jgi:hypothetical protein
MGERVDWRIAADRAVVGERVQLKTMDGYWIKPRRYTKQGEAEIKAAELKPMMRHQSVRRQLIKEAGRQQSEADKATGTLPDEVQEKIMDAVIGGLDADALSQLEASFLRIKFGVAEHNFEIEDGGPSTREWAVTLSEVAPDTFDEILELVQEKNRPLATTTPQ